LVAGKILAQKAQAIIPIKDRPYGKRKDRLHDPLGHLWIQSQQVAK